MTTGLVGSEMCIRDRYTTHPNLTHTHTPIHHHPHHTRVHNTPQLDTHSQTNGSRRPKSGWHQRAVREITSRGELLSPARPATPERHAISLQQHRNLLFASPTRARAPRASRWRSERRGRKTSVKTIFQVLRFPHTPPSPPPPPSPSLTTITLPPRTPLLLTHTSPNKSSAIPLNM